MPSPELDLRLKVLIFYFVAVSLTDPSPLSEGEGEAHSLLLKFTILLGILIDFLKLFNQGPFPCQRACFISVFQDYSFLFEVSFHNSPKACEYVLSGPSLLGMTLSSGRGSSLIRVVVGR